MAEPDGGRDEPGHIPLDELRRRLRDAHPSYQLLAPLNTDDDEARFRFTGPFEGREVVWEATLVTLDHYVRMGCEHGRYRLGETVQLQQFLEISDEPIEPLPILIVHDIPRIDHGRLLKTVIMVRNYKRLHRGHHPYGESHSFLIESSDD